MMLIKGLDKRDTGNQDNQFAGAIILHYIMYSAGYTVTTILCQTLLLATKIFTFFTMNIL